MEYLTGFILLKNRIFLEKEHLSCSPHVQEQQQPKTNIQQGKLSCHMEGYIVNWPVIGHNYVFFLSFVLE